MQTQDEQTFGEALHMTMDARDVTTWMVSKATGTPPAVVWRVLHGGESGLRWIIPLAKWMGLTEKELWQLLEAESRE